jgi:two-component system NarL family response regulator
MSIDNAIPELDNATTVIRVLLADDHRVVREGLAALLNNYADIAIVAQASNGADAVQLWRELNPDVALVDLSMPVLDGVQTIAAIREFAPHARAIVLSTFDGDEDIFRAFNVGAKGYLLKDVSPAELISCIRTVHSGRVSVSPTVAEKLAGRVGSDTLTEREKGILALVARGESNKIIARDLGISEGTVKTHLKSILGKLDAMSRTEAVAIGLKRGLIRRDNYSGQ